MENLDPPPPKSKMGKWRISALRAASSLIWGGGGAGGRGFSVPFYFVQDCSYIFAPSSSVAGLDRELRLSHLNKCHVTSAVTGN